MKLLADHHHRWKEQREYPVFMLYGSLREGMNNRFRIGQAAESIGVVKLSGFAMYARVDYPYVLASGNPADEITVELVRITNPDIVNRMCDFESGEGYFPVLVNAADFTAWIFMFSNPGQDPRIQGGDWVKAGIP